MNKPKIKSDEAGYDSDADQELKGLEQELGFILEEYDVEYPSESQMMQTIDAIRPYVPDKEDKWKSFYNNMVTLMKQTLNETLYMSSLFWITNSIFLLLGLLVVFHAEQNPYMIIMLLAPIPTLTGLIEVLKRRNAEMDELEMTLKYSLQEIILSKMMAVGGFNLAVNLILTCSISLIYQDIWIWKLLMYWVAPFAVATVISLAIVSRFRRISAVTTGLALWIVMGSLISQTRIIEQIESVPASIYMVITLIAVIGIIIQITQIYRRGVTFEINH